MKAAAAHDLKDDELVAKLIDAKQEAFNLRFRHATGELENTARLGVAKRDIAKLLTVARERGIDVERELKKDTSEDEQKKDETTEEQVGPQVEEAPAEGSEAEAAEAPEEAAEEPAAEQIESEAEPAAAEEKPAAESSPEDDLPWKERRLERSRRPHEAGPQQSPEEWKAARAAGGGS